MKSLQIGMTATSGRRGGLDRYFFNLAAALPKAGVSVEGLVVGSPDAIPAQTPGVRSFARDDATMFARWSSLRRHASKLAADSDVFVSHFAGYAFPILDIARKRPFVVHFHGPWSLEGRAEGVSSLKTTGRHVIERAVYRRARRCVVLSSAFGEMLAREFGVDDARIRVVPGGVDIDQFQVESTREEARRKLGWPPDVPLIVTIRRLVRAKGVENLVDAMPAVLSALPQAHVRIVGTGPLASELTAQVRRLNLEDRIQLTGHIPDADLALVYRAADLLVVPTITLEGFGLVVIEALATGTPVLVSPVGGLPEVVAELDSKLVLESHTADSIARGIIATLSGGTAVPSREQCSAYARRFAWNQIAARVGEVYREVV